MARSIGIIVLATAGALWSPPTYQVHAQGPQWCPLAGTVTKGTNSRGEYSVTHKGADPQDSSVCISVAEGPGIGGFYFGKTIRRIYGWYDISTNSLTSETEKRARDGLGAVLSGRSQEVSYEMTLNRNNTGWSGTESWKRTGQAILSIGGRPTSVVTLRETFKGGANTNYDGYWDIWYDPALHIIVKAEQHSTGGPIRFASDVVSISSPSPSK